jgi:DnaJ family protein C protein 13
MEALETAFKRCVSVLSASRKEDDVAVEVCTHIVRCYFVSAQFAACRDRLIEMPELVKNICRLMYYKHLTNLSSVTRSLWSILAIPNKYMKKSFVQPTPDQPVINIWLR